jgi:hypothetical protein
MHIKPKRPRLEKGVRLINKKTYEDYNQKKPNPEDPNEVKSTPIAPLPNSEVEREPPKVEEKSK